MACIVHSKNLIQMMRYFYYLTGWLACWLVQPALALADSSTASPSQQHFAPMEDWQLPSFVANSPSASDNTPTTSAKRKSVVTHISLNFRDSHPSSSSSSKSTKTASTSTGTKTQTSGTSTSTKSARLTCAPSAKSDKTVAASTLKSDKKCSLALTDKTHDTSHLPRPSVISDPTSPAFHSTASTKGTVDRAFVAAVHSTAQAAQNGFSAAKTAFAGRLARLTAYWAGEGDYYTGRHLSSTGIHLHGGLCAVDPSIIPYGSVVVIPGVGQFLAADTGSAVVSREAAREAGRTLAERGALVIDIYFDRRSDGEAFAAEKPVFVPISWWTPSSNSNAAQAARNVFADEDWNKIYSKQL
jgi:3D (Asp-Asp-Asp) domain-containing protein